MNGADEPVWVYFHSKTTSHCALTHSPEPITAPFRETQVFLEGDHDDGQQEEPYAGE